MGEALIAPGLDQSVRTNEHDVAGLKRQTLGGPCLRSRFFASLEPQAEIYFDFRFIPDRPYDLVSAGMLRSLHSAQLAGGHDLVLPGVVDGQRKGLLTPQEIDPAVTYVRHIKSIAPDGGDRGGGAHVRFPLTFLGLYEDAFVRFL